MSANGRMGDAASSGHLSATRRKAIHPHRRRPQRPRPPARAARPPAWSRQRFMSTPGLCLLQGYRRRAGTHRCGGAEGCVMWGDYMTIWNPLATRSSASPAILQHSTDRQVESCNDGEPRLSCDPMLRGQPLPGRPWRTSKRSERKAGEARQIHKDREFRCNPGRSGQHWS